jgi:hypothetical protein
MKYGEICVHWILERQLFNAFGILSDYLQRFHDIRREEKKKVRSTMNYFKSYDWHIVMYRDSETIRSVENSEAAVN